MPRRVVSTTGSTGIRAGRRQNRALNVTPTMRGTVSKPVRWLKSMTPMRLDPVSTLVIGDAALVLYLARDYERAERLARRVLALDDDNLGALTQLVNIAADRGDVATTVEHGAALGRAVRGDTSTTTTFADPAAAWTSFWLAWIDWFRANTAGPAREYQTALGFMRLGQQDSALARLEAGFALAAGGMAFVAAEPAFDPIRDLPRFRALLADMGLDAAAPSSPRAGLPPGSFMTGQLKWAYIGTVTAAIGVALLWLAQRMGRG
jgi:hypothetical protein